MVSAHHTRDGRAELPDHYRPPTSREKRGPTPDPDVGNPRTTTDQKIVHAPDSAGTNETPPLRRRIRLTLAEVRRLFNVRDQAKRVIHIAMKWSTYRREHQAEARKHHITRRLKIQHLAL
jgi:hypothetical protein